MNASILEAMRYWLLRGHSMRSAYYLVTGKELCDAEVKSHLGELLAIWDPS